MESIVAWSTQGHCLRTLAADEAAETKEWESIPVFGVAPSWKGGAEVVGLFKAPSKCSTICSNVERLAWRMRSSPVLRTAASFEDREDREDREVEEELFIGESGMLIDGDTKGRDGRRARWEADATALIVSWALDLEI